LAFCCAQADGFQIVLDTQGANIAKIMQSLTIAYAMYRGSKTKLFTQRYKSIALHSEQDVKAAIEDIINNPSYSGCCYKIDQTIKFDWLSVSPKQLFYPHAPRQPLSAEQAKQQLQAWLDQHACSELVLKQDKQKRNQCLVEFRQKHECSLKTLATLFNLSESSVSKILKNSEQAS
jgi:hypothetical protein